MNQEKIKRADEAKAILELMRSRYMEGSVKPWQDGFLGTQYMLSTQGYGDYQPDEFQLGVLRGIRDEHFPAREIEVI